MKSQRKTGDFQECQVQIRAFEDQEDNAEIALWYSDETSFSLNPASMYAWQAPQDCSLVLAAQRGKVMSVLGFIRHNNEHEFYEFQGNMCSNLWVSIMDDFVEKQGDKKTVIIVDNASTHHAQITKSKRTEWETKNVFIHYLKPYCSKLNSIETLWRFIKQKCGAARADKCLRLPL